MAGMTARPAVAVALRVLAAVPGGFACTTGLVGLLVALLSSVAGMARSEAVLLASMLGFLIYLALLVWAFAERRLWLVWTVFLGGGAGAACLALVIHGA
jgi:hypothetical protein